MYNVQEIIAKLFKTLCAHWLPGNFVQKQGIVNEPGMELQDSLLLKVPK